MDHVVGDATDPVSVAKAIAGCDAVAVFSMDSPAVERTRRTNLAATETMLRAALDNGCDPVIHISSTAALLRPDGMVIGDSPRTTVKGRYKLRQLRQWSSPWAAPRPR